MCPEVPRGRICTLFSTAVGVADVITCDKYFGDGLSGVDSVGVENCPFPLTKPVAVNTDWRYRAACDLTTTDDRRRRAKQYCPLGASTVLLVVVVVVCRSRRRPLHFV